MCGIAGILARDEETPIPAEWIARMMYVQAHRGPDDSHLIALAGCVLGFNRLSVLDVSKNGRQPMVVDGSDSAIVFNGEIYNFVELAQDHLRRGVRFRSRSDTEVLLHSYLLKGEDCLGDLNGMWAFAVYDPVESVLFAARDRFGVKPLYYFMDEEFFCFASEIKAILQLPFVARKPNLPILFGGMFERSNDRSEQTSFEGILQLPPSHRLRVSRQEWKIRTKRYWSVNPAEPDDIPISERNTEKAAEEFKDLLRSAVALRLRSDRPIGLLLSGGLDSSSIAASLAALSASSQSGGGAAHRVYTMALPGESMDESRCALETSRRLGMPCRLIEATRPDFERLVPAALWHNDEPLPLLNRCVHWHMMEQIAAEGVIVVLNGQGGDECSGGYFERLVGSTLAMALKDGGPRSFLGEWRQARWLCGFSRAWLLGQFAKTFLGHRWVRTWRALTHERALRLATSRLLDAGILRDHSPRLVRTDYVNDQLMRWLTRDTVPDLCHYEDRNSAAHGLEERFPFLDYRMAEFMFRLPWHYKTWQGVSKVLVRKAMGGTLPDSVTGSHRKIGLGVPEGKWVSGPLATLVQDVAASRSFRERGLWRATRIRRMIDMHMAGRRDLGNLIWRIIGTELWFRMFIDGEKPGVLHCPARSRPVSA